MDDRLARLEATVEQLGSNVRALERRLVLLESGQRVAAREGPPGSLDAAPSTHHATPGVRAERDLRDPIAILSLIGRLFLVLAGGFFLRAMTEAGLLPVAVGVSAAFAYSFVWLYLADRASRRGQEVGGAFHAAGFALVSFPLLVEATTRFKVLPPNWAALVLLLATAIPLWVAWRRRLKAVAWITIVIALPTSVVMVLKTGHVMPFALQPVALGVTTLWLGYELGWRGIRWPAALVANLVVAGVTLRALAPQQPDAVQVAVIMQWVLLASYVGSIGARTVLRRGTAGWFEIVQSAAVLLLGVGGTLVLAGGSPARGATLGAVSLALSIWSYALLFSVFEKREDSARNVWFYSMVALVLMLLGWVLLIPAPWSGVVLAALSVAAAAFWAQQGRLHMLVNAAAFLAAAVATSGELLYGAGALLTAPTGPWVQPGPAIVLVLLASLACVVLVARRPAPEGGSIASGLRLVAILACAWAVASCVTGWLEPLTIGLSERGMDLGALATLRTGVLALGTLAVAWIGRHERFREWGWLVYPMLVVVGLKMVAQDFGQSRPATLFIALAIYGAALIVAPRLRRGRRDGKGADVPTLAGAAS